MPTGRKSCGRSRRVLRAFPPRHRYNSGAGEPTPFLACWTPRLPEGKVKGAFLVSPPDHESRSAPRGIGGFGGVPRDPLPFPSLLVASINDIYVTPDRAADIAAAVVVLSIPHGKGAIHAGYDHPCKTLEHGEIATSAFGPVLVFCHLRAIPIVAMAAP